MRKSWLGQMGQTSVEYMLVIAVSVTLGITFKKKMTDYFLRNPNSFIGGTLKKFKVQFEGTENGRPYKNFRVIPRTPRRNR